MERVAHKLLASFSDHHPVLASGNSAVDPNHIEMIDLSPMSRESEQQAVKSRKIFIPMPILVEKGKPVRRFKAVSDSAEAAAEAVFKPLGVEVLNADEVNLKRLAYAVSNGKDEDVADKEEQDEVKNFTEVFTTKKSRKRFLARLARSTTTETSEVMTTDHTTFAGGSFKVSSTLLPAAADDRSAITESTTQTSTDAHQETTVVQKRDLMEKNDSTIYLPTKTVEPVRNNFHNQNVNLRRSRKLMWSIK
jgi:ketosteroid isomerase-like protein